MLCVLFADDVEFMCLWLHHNHIVICHFILF